MLLEQIEHCLQCSKSVTDRNYRAIGQLKAGMGQLVRLEGALTQEMLLEIQQLGREKRARERKIRA